LKQESLDVRTGASGSTAYFFTSKPASARAVVAALLNSVALQEVIVAEELDVRPACPR
jgi:hypothetical protein